MKASLLFAGLLFFMQARSQEINGIWRGYFNDINYQRENQSSRYKFEVQIDQDGSEFKAVTYSYLSTVFYGKATAQGTFNPKTNKVYLEEIKLVEVKMTDFSSTCIMTCFLQYSKSGDEEFLEGDFFSNNSGDNRSCGRGTVFLRKVSTSDFYKEPFDKPKESASTPPLKPLPKSSLAGTGNPVKKDPVTPDKSSNGTNKIAGKPKVTATKNNLKVSGTEKNPVKNKVNKNAAGSSGLLAESVKGNSRQNPIQTFRPEEINEKPVRVDSGSTPRFVTTPKPLPRVLINRTNEVAHVINTSSHSVEVRLYDNGYVDNDTISIYLDNELLIKRHRLTDKPLSFSIDLDDSHDFHELVMVAENMGEIPPNTSLMIVNADGKTYEIRITSTEQKNATVQFRFKH